MPCALRSLRSTLLLGLLCLADPLWAADFDATLNVHLQAIQDRDLEGLMATVSEQPAPNLILPGGQLLQGKAAFRDLHVQWFADPDWRMDVSEVNRTASAEMASVLLRYTLRDRPEPGQGNPRSAFLLLVFQRIEGEWLLVHDQNTRIPETGDPAQGHE
jgi:ketosteroid isomerase-like protein